MTLDEKLIDKRVVRRNLERGRIDAAAYKSMLEALPDASANVHRYDAALQAPVSEPARPAEPRLPVTVADFSAGAP